MRLNIEEKIIIESIDQYEVLELLRLNIERKFISDLIYQHEVLMN